jgi:hypothetical protein
MENPEKLAKYGTQDEDKQSRETGNIGYRRRTKQKHNICWKPLYANKHK